MSNKQPSQAGAPNFEEIENDDCTHVGYFVGFGFDTFPVQGQGFVVTTGVICMRCGKKWIDLKTLTIQSDKQEVKSDIIRP